MPFEPAHQADVRSQMGRELRRNAQKTVFDARQLLGGSSLNLGTCLVLVIGEDAVIHDDHLRVGKQCAQARQDQPEASGFILGGQDDR